MKGVGGSVLLQLPLAPLFGRYSVHDPAMRRSCSRGNDRNAAHWNAGDARVVVAAVVAIVAVANDDAVDMARGANQGAGKRLRLHREDTERDRGGKP
jgi:hypothetical protein